MFCFNVVLAPVVRKVDNAIHWLNVSKTKYAINWISIYSVDSVIHLLNNRGLTYNHTTLNTATHDYGHSAVSFTAVVLIYEIIKHFIQIIFGEQAFGMVFNILQHTGVQSEFSTSSGV